MEIKRNLNRLSRLDYFSQVVVVSISYGDKEKFEPIFDYRQLLVGFVSISYGDKEKFELCRCIEVTVSNSNVFQSPMEIKRNLNELFCYRAIEPLMDLFQSPMEIKRNLNVNFPHPARCVRRSFNLLWR